MHRDYHPATFESIPLSDNRLPAVGHRPVHGHYCSTSGDWDGQLHNSDIAASVKRGPENRVSNWPALVDRMEWARTMVRIHGLSPPQAAALKEVAYRDGLGQGCTASMNTIAQDTGYNERSIRRAIKELAEKNMVIAHASVGRPRILCLPVKNGKLTCSALEDETGAAAPVHPQTSVRESGVGANCGQRGRSTQDGESWHPALVQTHTSVRKSEVRANSGQRIRGTPDGESAITKREQNLEIAGNASVTISSHSVLSSVEPEPAVRPRELTTDEGLIRALVIENWPLLVESGWKYLCGALKHYRDNGLEHFQQDLTVKREKIERARLASRTCAHCHTVYEELEQVQPCVRCGEPKCASHSGICTARNCYRKRGSVNQIVLRNWHCR